MPTKPTSSATKAERREFRAGQKQRPMMTELYRRAEAQLRSQRRNQKTKPGRPVFEADPARQLHELQVHQVELEMQNVELQKVRDELEIALEKYTDLYEFAPVGYFTLAPDSTIRLVNLTGTVLVGVGRARLVGQTFAGLLAVEARSEFHSFLKQVFAAQTRLSRDFELLRPGLPPRAVNMEAQRLPDGRQCRAVLVDITARLQAEQNVRESEERFRVMANAMPQLAWIARPDGHILWYNQRWYDYTGTTLKQMEGWGWQRVHDAAVLPKVLKRWKASIATGEPFDMTFPLRGADGLFRPFLTRIIPLKNADGQVVQWFGTNTDVAEQQRAEEKVRVSEVRYRRLFEAAHDGVLILDPATRKITDANPFMTELLGHQHAQLVGKELFEIGLLEDEAASRKMFRVLKKTHEVRYDDLPLKNRSGRHQEVEVVANLYRENGHTVIQCNIRDITTRKAAERQLAEKARLLDLSHDAIIVRDMQGRIRYWNHGAEQLYGWSQPEALGKVGRDLLQTEFSTPVKRMTAELRRAGHWTGELVQTSRAGRRITVLARLTLDRDGQNRPVAVLENFTDITKRKQVEDALHQSEHNLAAELAATQHLHQVSTQLIQADHVEELYEKILDTLVTIMRSDFASIQMFCPERGELRLVGFRGFNPQGAKYWEWVRPTSESTCGVALRTGQRSIVPDVRKCEWMAGSADLQAHVQIGIQAVQTTPLFSHSGALIGMLSTHWREPHDPSASELRIMDVLARQAADLIERKQAEEQLQQNNRTFLSLIQNAPFGLYVVDAQFRLSQVSTASQKVFANICPLIGRDFEEVVRTAWPDPFASEVLARFRHTLETGDPYAAPNTVQQRHDNMAVESYDWKIERMTLPNGQFGVVCYFYDMTERNLAATALRESEERYRNLFDSIDEGFCVIEMIFDEDNKPVDFLFLEANPAFEKQSGVTEATGRRMSEIVTAGVEAHWFETYGQVALTGEPVRFTNECKPLSRWFDIYACRVGGPESRKVAVVFSDITERKKTEQELAERARLLDLSHDAIVVRDMEGHIRYWNRGAEELYGWSRQEALGKISHLLLQTKFSTPLKQMTEELYRTDRWIGELGHATRAGRHLIVLARKTLDRDGQGQPVAVLENLTDITARKQGEEALRASEARFRTAVGVVTSLIWTNNAEGLMEGEQPGWASFTGQALAEYQGYGWAKAVHPQDGPPTVAVWKRAVAEKSIFEFEHRLRRRDGAWRLCSVRAVPVLDENGQIREWVGVHTDITERKQAEAALRESEERFRTLFASAPMGVFACDRNAVIEHCNQRAVEMWGREPECGVERYCGSVKLWQPDGTLLPHEKSPMVEVLRTGQPALNVEISIQRPDGSLLPALVNIAALKNAEGEITGAITSFMDITERKQAEDMLRRSEAMFTALVEQSPLGVYVVDQQLRLQQVNPRAMSFFAGIEPLLGRSFSEILQAVWPHRVATEVLKRFRQTLQTGEPYQSPEFTERRRDTGLKQTYEWQIQRVTLRAGEQGVVCFFSNITARKKAEEAQRRLEVITATNLGLHKEIMRRQAVEDSLRKSEQHQKLLVKQAQQLAYQVRHAEEAERLRISRELHDQVAQTLVGINLQIGALTAHLSAPTLGFHEQLTKTQRLVEKSVDIVHAFARDLRPTLLDDLGLVPALDSFVKSFMERTGLPVRFTCFAGVEKLDNAKRTVLYRIAQEALNNVHKHAHATLVEMDICQLARHVIMTIQDNGRGASTDLILKAKGRRLGLVGMRERLEMVGGSFKILGVKGQGTTVQAKVPFRTVPLGGNSLPRVLLTIKG